MDWHKYFYYDENCGSKLRRKIKVMCGKGNSTLRVAQGEEVGSLLKLARSSYYVTKMNKRMYKIHRIIWEMVNGSIPEGYCIDHIDGNSMNNLISNLRCVTHVVNCRNRKRNSNNKSGVPGVAYVERPRNNGSSDFYWMACWVTIEGLRRGRNFSVSKIGYNEAFNLACEYRKKMIMQLNKDGAGYTNRDCT